MGAETAGPGNPPNRRRRTLWLVVAVAVLVAVTGSLFWFANQGSDRTYLKKDERQTIHGTFGVGFSMSADGTAGYEFSGVSGATFTFCFRKETGEGEFGGGEYGPPFGCLRSAPGGSRQVNLEPGMYSLEIECTFQSSGCEVKYSVWKEE